MSHILDISSGIKVLTQPQKPAMSHVLEHTQAEYYSMNTGICSLFEAFMTLTHLNSNERVHFHISQFIFGLFCSVMFSLHVNKGCITLIVYTLAKTPRDDRDGSQIITELT